MNSFDWQRSLIDQWEYHWTNQIRPRLDGLGDEEYRWSPAPAAWNVHPRGESSAPVQAGSGDFTIDFAFPEPDPAPFTTIAWRLGHVIVGVLAARNVTHFPAASTEFASKASYEDWDYAGDAATALKQLDTQIDVWLTGLRGLDEDALRVPLGEKEPFPELAMADLVLHINRELIHHLSEVCLLRDLYRHTHGGDR